MKTAWDYTELATAYLTRPQYAAGAIDALVALADLKAGARVCDVGAGVAHLTLELEKRGFNVVAVEPNDAMRALGKTRTSSASWVEASGENTLQPDASFDLVTFGSSFNVVDSDLALAEVKRILVPGGWFACMWNHRDLEDSIQKHIESLISESVAGYDYGTRRKDQSATLEASGLFVKVHAIEAGVLHRQTKAQVVEAWRSHATLQRQAGESFHLVIQKIEEYLDSLGSDEIEIPYTTRMWCAQLK